MFRKLILASLLTIPGSIVLMTPVTQAVPVPDYSFDCSVDPNGASTDFAMQTVYLSPGETIRIEAIGCSVLCGEGSNVNDGGFCGSYSHAGGDFTAVFTDFGYFSGRAPGDSVVYWYNVIADPADINLQATPGDGSLDFTWNPVSYTWNSVASSASVYAVALDDFSQVCFVVAPAPNACSFTGLTNDQSHAFKIRVRYPWGGGTDIWYPSSNFTPSATTTTTSTTTTTTTTTTSTTIATTTTSGSTTTDPDDSTTTVDSITTESSVEETLVPTGASSNSSPLSGLLLVMAGISLLLVLRRRTTVL